MTSIKAPDGLHFGDTFMVEYEPPRRYTGGLWARADCYQNGTHVYAQYVNVDDTSSQDGPFTLGPTPSWSGGAASCTVRLLALSGTRRDKELATDDFEVLA